MTHPKPHIDQHEGFGMTHGSWLLRVAWAAIARLLRARTDRQAVVTLQQMDDWMLRDIGLNRSDIDAVTMMDHPGSATGRLANIAAERLARQHLASDAANS